MEYNNNNIFNKPINNINGKSNMDKKPKTEDEKMLDFAVKMCSQKLAESTENYVPEYNKFSPHKMAFLIPGTSNIAEITIKHDEQDYKTQRRIYIGVHHKNSDMVVQNSVFKGTKQEVIEYLKTLSDERLEETVQNIQELSDESDKEHDAL